MYNLKQTLDNIHYHMQNNSEDAALVVLASAMLDTVYSSEVRKLAEEVVENNI